MNARKEKPADIRVQAWKIRLFPNAAAERSMVQFRGGSVCVYNWAIEQYRNGWDAYCEVVAELDEGLSDADRKAAKKEAKSLWANRFAMSKALTQIKQAEPVEGGRDYRWWADVDRATLERALIDADLAWQRFLKSRREAQGGDGRERFPRFRSARKNESFRYQRGVQLKAVPRTLPDGRCVETQYVYLPKIGWVKLRDDRMPEGRITQATVMREHEKWYCCVFTERVVAVKQVTVDPATAVGVILGVDAIVTTHAGEQTLNPQYLERDLARLARAQRDLARKQGGRKTGKPSSKNRIKAVKRVQRIHVDVARKRRDLHDKISRAMVDAGSAVMTQDADFRAEQAARAPKASHRKMADAGRGALRLKLAYKAAWAGKSFVAVESREDSGDGEISLSARALAVRAAGLAVLASSRTPVEGDGQ